MNLNSVGTYSTKSVIQPTLLIIGQYYHQDRWYFKVNFIIRVDDILACEFYDSMPAKLKFTIPYKYCLITLRCRTGISNIVWPLGNFRGFIIRLGCDPNYDTSIPKGSLATVRKRRLLGTTARDCSSIVWDTDIGYDPSQHIY